MITIYEKNYFWSANLAILHLRIQYADDRRDCGPKSFPISSFDRVLSFSPDTPPSVAPRDKVPNNGYIKMETNELRSK